MKGTVTKLWDIDSIEIPAELLEVKADPRPVEEEISALPLRYAAESQAQTAEMGDIVRCKAPGDSYPDGRTILLFTGTDLPGGEAAAKAALGTHPGDTFAAELAGKPVTLTVESVIRRTPAEVNDGLIASMGLEGVHTLADYRSHLMQKAEADAQMEAGKALMAYLMDELIRRSTFDYDEKEMQAAIDRAKADLTAAPEEAAPSEEELAQSVIYQYKQGWAAEAFCREKGIAIDEEGIGRQAQQLSQMMELMGEPVPEEEELLDMARSEECLMPLFEHINNLITERMGG